MTNREALAVIRKIQDKMRPFLDGHIDPGDLKDLNRQLRKVRRLIKRELQAAMNDEDNMDIVYLVWAALSAAELAILTRGR